MCKALTIPFLPNRKQYGYHHLRTGTSEKIRYIGHVQVLWSAVCYSVRCGPNPYSFTGQSLQKIASNPFQQCDPIPNSSYPILGLILLCQLPSFILSSFSVTLCLWNHLVSVQNKLSLLDIDLSFADIVIYQDICVPVQ